MVEYFTKEGLKKLQDELHYLKTAKTKEIADLLKYAASFGDLKENAGYHDAKDRQEFLVKRIKDLEKIVHNAVVSNKIETDKIQIGSVVLISMDGSEEKMEIVAPGESDILKGKISYQSPLGQKLMGKKAGEEFNFNGTKVKILEVK